ncbi:MAG TPA: GtrA family protein [Terriglobales bacterium]|nr:GtrA family protein [Terriglobales bacterium]
MNSRFDFTNWEQTVIRWLKFNFVGAVGIIVQLVVLSILKSGLGLDYLAATALAVETAVIHNFLWHERFTWLDRITGTRRDMFGRLARFNLTTGLISILGNLLLMRTLVGHFHVNYMMANILAIGTCALANFLVSDQFVFRKLHSEG